MIQPTQNMEDDTRHVEIIESSGINEPFEVGDHLNHKSSRKQYVPQKCRCTPKVLSFIAAAIILVFIFGKKAS